MSDVTIKVRDDWFRFPVEIRDPGCDACRKPAVIVHVRRYDAPVLEREMELYCEDCCPIVIVQRNGFYPKRVDWSWATATGEREIAA